MTLVELKNFLETKWKDYLDQPVVIVDADEPYQYFFWSYYIFYKDIVENIRKKIEAQWVGLQFFPDKGLSVPATARGGSLGSSWLIEDIIFDAKR